MALSLKDFPEKEQYRLVNTPKSLEACYREGIRPEELLYAPLEEFARPNLPKEIQYMNYNFYETQRKKLLRLAKFSYLGLESQKKSPRTYSEFPVKEIIGLETQRIKEKQMKHISKLVNYKLENIKSSIETESNPLVPHSKPNNFSNDKDETSQSKSLLHKRTNTGITDQSQKKLTNSVSARNLKYKKDRQLIETEKKEKERFEYFEKQKYLEIENNRKKNEELLQKHIQKAREIKNKEIEKKLEKIRKKEEMAEQKMRKIYSSRLENRKKNFYRSQDKFLKVVSSKQQFDEYIQEIRNQIVKEENDKIANHEKNKNKVMEEFKDRIKEKNKKRDLKSKQSRENIEKKTEEKKEEKMKEMRKRDEKIAKLKEKYTKSNEYQKEKNKLKEIEKNWNIERVKRKEEYSKNQVMSQINSATERVNGLLSARSYMQKYRYEINLQSESQKSQIANALYQMEVQKKFDLNKLRQILSSENISSDIPSLSATSKDFNKTR